MSRPTKRDCWAYVLRKHIHDIWLFSDDELVVVDKEMRLLGRFRGL